MELKRIDSKTSARVAGTVGLIAAACIACCLPLLAPMFAGLGLAGLGAAATGWYWAAAGFFAIGLGAVLFTYRHRRTAMSLRTRNGGTCGCAKSCKT